MSKASVAYGDSVVRDARSAIAWLLDRVEVPQRCQQEMAMNQPPAVLIDRLRRLSISLASAWPIDDEKRG